MQLLAACQKAPSIQPARREVLRRGLRLLAARPRDVHRGHGPQGAAAGRLRQGLGRGRGLRARVLPPPARRRDLDAAVRQHHRPGHQDRAHRLLHPAGHPGAVRLRRPAAVRARGRRRCRRCCWPRPARPAASSTSPGDGVDHRPAGRAPGRPARRCRCRWRPAGCSASSSGAPAWPTSPRTRCSTSPSGAAWTPPGCAQVLRPRARGSPPGRRSRTSSPRPAPGCRARRSLGSVADGLAGTAAGILAHAAAAGEEPPDGRPRRRADPRRLGARQARPPPRGADALAAGAARASGERARRRRTPLISDPAAGDRGARVRRAAGDRRRGGPGTPPAVPRRYGGRGRRHRRAAAPRTRLSVHRPRPVPRSSAVRLGKAASAERSETRSPRAAAAAAPAPVRAAPDADRGREPTAGVRPPTPAPDAPAGSRVSGIEELVHVAVSVLRLAAEASGLSGEDVERQVADTLAFLRRRLTGDYEVDEFGFDADFTEHAYLPLLRPLYRVVVPGRGPRHREHPAPGRRAGRGQPLRHHRARLADDPGRRARRAPRAPAPADARRRPGLPDAVRRRHRPQERLDPGRQPRRRAAARLRRARSASGPRASRASASRSASGTSCSGSAAAGSSRRRCAPARRSSRARSSAPRRSTRSSATSRRWPGCSACRTSRSPRPSRCSARSG